MMLCPNVSSASILLYYLFKEASFVPQVPSHVPQTRSIAVSTQRSGPTMEDCSRMAKYRTPTVADQQLLFLSSVNMADTSMSRSMMHNDDFSRAVLEPSTGVFATGYPYAPGILSGLWEGYYMVHELSIIFPLNLCLFRSRSLRRHCRMLALRRRDLRMFRTLLVGGQCSAIYKNISARTLTELCLNPVELRAVTTVRATPGHPVLQM